MNPYSTSPLHTQTQNLSPALAFLSDNRKCFSSPTSRASFYRFPKVPPSHTSSHTFAGPWRLPPPVSVPVRSVSPYFCLYMPPPRLFIRFCTVGGVPLSSTTGPSFPCFSRENGPAIFAITYLVPYFCERVVMGGRRAGAGAVIGGRLMGEVQVSGG